MYSNRMVITEMLPIRIATECGRTQTHYLFGQAPQSQFLTHWLVVMPLIFTHHRIILTWLNWCTPRTYILCRVLLTTFYFYAITVGCWHLICIWVNLVPREIYKHEFEARPTWNDQSLKNKCVQLMRNVTSRRQNDNITAWWMTGT